MPLQFDPYGHIDLCIEEILPESIHISVHKYFVGVEGWGGDPDTYYLRGCRGSKNDVWNRTERVSVLTSQASAGLPAKWGQQCQRKSQHGLEIALDLQTKAPMEAWLYHLFSSCGASLCPHLFACKIIIKMTSWAILLHMKR